MLDFLGRMFFGLVSFFRTTLGQMVIFMIAPVVGFFALIMRLVASLESRFNELISAGTNAAGDAIEFTTGTFIGIANRFVPLDVMFTYCVALLSLWLVALVYRTIKSFIPTLS